MKPRIGVAQQLDDVLDRNHSLARCPRWFLRLLDGIYRIDASIPAFDGKVEQHRNVTEMRAQRRRAPGFRPVKVFLTRVARDVANLAILEMVTEGHKETCPCCLDVFARPTRLQFHAFELLHHLPNRRVCFGWSCVLQIEIDGLCDVRIVFTESSQRREDFVTHDVAEVAQIDWLFFGFSEETLLLETLRRLRRWEALEDTPSAHEAHVHPVANIPAGMGFLVDGKGLFEAHNRRDSFVPRAS